MSRGHSDCLCNDSDGLLEVDVELYGRKVTVLNENLNLAVIDAFLELVLQDRQRKLHDIITGRLTVEHESNVTRLTDEADLGRSLIETFDLDFEQELVRFFDV